MIFPGQDSVPVKRAHNSILPKCEDKDGYTDSGMHQKGRGKKKRNWALVQHQTGRIEFTGTYGHNSAREEFRGALVLEGLGGSCES